MPGNSDTVNCVSSGAPKVKFTGYRARLVVELTVELINTDNDLSGKHRLSHERVKGFVIDSLCRPNMEYADIRVLKVRPDVAEVTQVKLSDAMSVPGSQSGDS